MLTVLVSTTSNLQVFLLKNVSSFSYSHFFIKYISVYAVLNDQSFNDTLTNDIVSFEQLSPDVVCSFLAFGCICFSFRLEPLFLCFSCLI